MPASPAFRINSRGNSARFSYSSRTGTTSFFMNRLIMSRTASISAEVVKFMSIPRLISMVLNETLPTRGLSLRAAPVHEGRLHFLRDRSILLDASPLERYDAAIRLARFPFFDDF